MPGENDQEDYVCVWAEGTWAPDTDPARGDTVGGLGISAHTHRDTHGLRGGEPGVPALGRGAGPLPPVHLVEGVCAGMCVT